MPCATDPSGNATTPGVCPGSSMRRGGMAYWTVNVPVMFGWTSHQNVYAPAGSAFTS